MADGRLRGRDLRLGISALAVRFDTAEINATFYGLAYPP